MISIPFEDHSAYLMKGFSCGNDSSTVGAVATVIPVIIILSIIIIIIIVVIIFVKRFPILLRIIILLLGNAAALYLVLRVVLARVWARGAQMFSVHFSTVGHIGCRRSFVVVLHQMRILFPHQKRSCTVNRTPIPGIVNWHLAINNKLSTKPTPTPNPT